MPDWLILILVALGGSAVYWFWVRLVLKPRHQDEVCFDLWGRERYAEAAEAFQARLTRRLSAGQEAHTRLLLAEMLDLSGRPEEATSERERCRAVARGAAKDPLALLTLGELLTQEDRAVEACGLYKRALSLATDGRAAILTKLAAAQRNAGRPEEAIANAEAALTSRPEASFKKRLHQIAGTCLASQGLLEEAETHLRHSLALAESEGKPEQVSDSLAFLAGIQYRRGQFAETIIMCQRARAVCSSPARRDLSIEAACLRDMGRFEEARSVMKRYCQGPAYPQPRTERRMQAHGSLESAWIEAYAARPEAALEHVMEAREGLKVPLNSSSAWPPPPLAGENHVVLICDATEAYVQAQLGQVEQARRLAVSVESRLTQVCLSRDTQITVYGFLGSAMLQLGDLLESRRLWTLYCECGPDPVGVPSVYLELGEIALRLGDTEEALWAFQHAVAPGIDSLDARRAQARLDEMGGVPAAEAAG